MKSFLTFLSENPLLHLDTIHGKTPVRYTKRHEELGITPKELIYVADWRDGSFYRKEVEQIARETIPGGRFEAFHPGEITVYRGMQYRGAPYKMVGTSWTKSLRLAKEYTDEGKKTYALKLTKQIPALDINKFLFWQPRDPKWLFEKEVFIPRGDWPVEIISNKK